MNMCKDYMLKDDYGKYTITNIYYDTPNYDLIRTSNDKPIYKEKVRLRSYGIPDLNTTVFLEIKKKYQKIVSKRRISLSLEDFYHYKNNGFEETDQVKKEIDYAFERYNLEPKVFVGYDREAFKSKEDDDLRITLDSNLRYRIDGLNLELGDAGIKFFDKPMYIMEVKCLGALPLWFAQSLSKYKIYPTSFSKYGNIYKRIIKEELHV